MRVILNNGSASRSINIEDGKTVADALAAAEWSAGNMQVRISGVKDASLSTPLRDGQVVMLIAAVKGN